MNRACLALCALAGCGTFQDPQIVVDLRVIGMRAEPPEQVFPFDPQHPPTTIDQLGIVDAQVCALIADPAFDRGLDWRMTLCAPTSDLRCDDATRPSFVLGQGTIADPDTSPTAQTPCATVPADASLLLVLEDAIQHDPYGGFSGVDVAVELRVVGHGLDEAHAVYGTKEVRYAAQEPADRVANHNPTVDHIDEAGATLDPHRCAEQASPTVVAPGASLRLTPIEPPGAREAYVVPTFDGGEEHFTESLSYQWLATAGSWSRGDSGGPRDESGVDPPLDSTWTAPPADQLDGPTDVSLWVIQRDERLGEQWTEGCVRVVPAP